ncbi:MSHA biogenesis protein MshI [Cellvibrio mixtus]|uniref:MSHA biogenesis protein MshI n=1 Tax=Cellvibrio mixtus TaxID=39650 RepID=UPI00058798F7|nr:MSHA biogenesis protein MshI [Cellvibrio mixtus]
MQQINLYLPEFQPNREPLRSVHMLWGVVIFIGLLLLVSYFSARSNRTLAEQVDRNRAQLDQLKSQATQLEQQKPASNIVDLDAQIVKLSQELSRRDQVFRVIANKNIGNNIGFSAHLQALGRQSLSTVSLEAFSLMYGGNYLEFAGKTRSVDQIPLYIQRLRNEPVFSSAAFGVLHARPQEKNAGVFEFSLTKESTIGVPDEPKTAVQMLLEENEEVNRQSRGQH